MARSDGPFEVIEMAGNNAYRLQLPGDMAVLTTFNIGDLSRYVEDTVEDSSYLRSNPSEEAGAYPQGYLKGDQGQGNQEQGALTSQIQALFSLPSCSIYTNLGNHFGDGRVVMIG